MQKLYIPSSKFENIQQKTLLAFAIQYRIHLALCHGRTPHILCLGTDRIIGDSLGPLTGTKLLESGCPIPVHGTLHLPIHNKNLPSFLSLFYKNYPNAYVIVIDSSFGEKEDIGKITFSDESLYPREGFSSNKKSPFCVGDFSITGIVHEKEDFSNFFNIRLYEIEKLSNYISELIYCSFQIHA